MMLCGVRQEADVTLQAASCLSPLLHSAANKPSSCDDQLVNTGRRHLKRGAVENSEENTESKRLRVRLNWRQRRRATRSAARECALEKTGSLSAMIKAFKGSLQKKAAVNEDTKTGGTNVDHNKQATCSNQQTSDEQSEVEEALRWTSYSGVRGLSDPLSPAQTASLDSDVFNDTALSSPSFSASHTSHYSALTSQCTTPHNSFYERLMSTSDESSSSSPSSSLTTTTIYGGQHQRDDDDEQSWSDWSAGDARVPSAADDVITSDHLGHRAACTSLSQTVDVSRDEKSVSVQVNEVRHLPVNVSPDDIFIEMSVRTKLGRVRQSDRSQVVNCATANFDVSSGDDRLVVSVNSQSAARHKRRSTGRVLGCVSFSIKKLIKKSKKQKPAVEGDCHLLPEELGLHKHSAVQPSRLTCQTSPANHNQCNMDSVKVVVFKSAAGFGFTVKGSSPVRVGRVKEGSSAQKSGLCAGDVILAINGQDVAHSKSTEVARIVKYSLTQIALDVYRPTQSTPRHSSDVINGRPLAVKSKQRGIVRRTAQSRPDPDLNTLNDCVLTPEYCARPAHRQSTKWHPGMSHITRVDNTPHLVPQSTRSEWSESNIYDEIADHTVRDWAADSVTTAADTSSFWEQLVNVSCDQTSFSSVDDVVTEQSYSVTDEEEEELSDSCSSLSDDELQCLASLMDKEASFVYQMCGGIQSFSRPLRHHILSPPQHQTLFQNIEKLVVLSEGFVKCMADFSSDLTMTSVYYKQMQVLCGAYSSYLTGLPSALTLLNQLSTSHDQFTTFIHHSHCDMSLQTFVEKPVQHFVELLSAFNSLSTSHDSQQLNYIINAMEGVLEQVTADKRSSSSSSLDSGIGHTAGHSTRSWRHKAVKRVHCLHESC